MQMKALKLALVAAAATFALAGAARAEDAPAEVKPLVFVFNVGANTDYMFRGVSQTDNKASIFGGLDVTIEGIGYAGVWLSNVDFLNGTKMEYDLYAGIKPVIGPVTVDLGVIRYGYTNEPSGPEETYTEFKIAPSMAVGPATVGLAYFYSEQFFGHTGPMNRPAKYAPVSANHVHVSNTSTHAPPDGKSFLHSAMNVMSSATYSTPASIAVTRAATVSITR